MRQEQSKTEMVNKAHEEIPGNPSTATSSKLKLNDRSNGKSLRVLSEEDWKFWMYNGYIVIKNAISKKQAKTTADFIWEFDEKDPNNSDTWYAPKGRNANERIRRYGNGRSL